MVDKEYKADGAFSRPSAWSTNLRGGDSDNWGGYINMTLSRNNIIYFKSTTVQPASNQALIIIKD